MRRSHYLASQLTGRLVFLVLEVAALVAFARFAFDVPLRGSWAALLLLSCSFLVPALGQGLLMICHACFGQINKSVDVDIGGGSRYQLDQRCSTGQEK